MSVPVCEQETVIQISRDSDKMEIWTSDTTMMTKLDKLVGKSTAYRCISVGKMNGDVVNKEYTADKALLSFRSNRRETRELTEEERASLIERFRS